MARNSQARLTNTIDIDPETGRLLDDDIPEADLQSDQDKAFDDIVNEFEAADDNVTYRASVCKVPDGYKRGGKEEWCFDVDSAEVTGMRLKIRDVFGPGIYRIRVYKNKKLNRQFDYHIAKPVGQMASSATADNPLINALTEQMRATNERLTQLTERFLTGPQGAVAPQISPMAMLREMSEVMKNLSGSQPVAKETSLDTFMKAAEFARDMMPDKGAGDDGWTGVIKALITSPSAGEIVQAITQQRNHNGQRPMQRRQLPLSQPPIQRPMQNSNPVPQNSAADLGEQLNSNMRYLIGKAERNSDPGLYAEWLLDNTNPDIIIPMLNDPNLLDQLSAAFPRMANVRDWFEDLVNSAKQIISEGMGSETSGEAPHADGTAVNFDDGAGGYRGHQGDPQTDGSVGQTIP